MKAIHGDRRSKLIQRRLTEMMAAENLSVLKALPGPRLHPLTQNRAGQYSVDLDPPYRLIFEPDHDPVPKLDAGGDDWKKITRVKISEITNTHE